MAFSKPLGWVLFVVGLVAAAYGLALVLRPASLPGWSQYGENTGYATLGVGAVLLLVGLVLIVRRAPIPMAPTPKSAPRPVETVEIKRTEMNWAPQATTADDEEDPALRAVRQRMAQLKVQYGLGQISPEAYAQLVKDLQDEEARLLRARLRGEPA